MTIMSSHAILSYYCLTTGTVSPRRTSASGKGTSGVRDGEEEEEQKDGWGGGGREEGT
jgi:hypothetical protein